MIFIITVVVTGVIEFTFKKKKTVLTEDICVCNYIKTQPSYTTYTSRKKEF